MHLPQLEQQLMLDDVVTVRVFADLRRDAAERLTELRDRIVPRQLRMKIAIGHGRRQSGRADAGGGHADQTDREKARCREQSEASAHTDNVILRRLPAPRHMPWQGARRILCLATAAALPFGLAACGGPAKRPPTGRRPGLTSIFEAPGQLISQPVQTLDELRRLGVDYVRVSIPWVALAPAPRSRYRPDGLNLFSPSAYGQRAWARYDAIVRAAQVRGIGVDLDPTGPAPRWATGLGASAGSPPGVWMPAAPPFGAFVEALGRRYNGRYRPPGAATPLPRVSFWSVWNEPNYGSDLAPQAIDGSTVEASPALYRELLDAAWAALQATGHAQDTILFGELAPSGITGPGYPGNFSGMVPLRFVRALYCVDQTLRPLTGAAAAARSCPVLPVGAKRFPAEHPALFHATGVAVHPYSQGALAPDLPTPDEPEYANLASLPRLAQILDSIQSAYGSSTRFPLYSTEYGYKTNPPYIAGAPLSLAPAYLNWAEYISWLDPRIRSYDQYLLSDPPSSTRSKFDSGLEFASGAPKSTLDAFRLPLYLPVTSARRGSRLEVWGCLRPARYAHGQDALTGRIEFSRRGGGPYQAVRSVTVSPGSCYFDLTVRFPASGFVRLSWSYPGGTTVHSRIVPVSLR